MSKVRDDSYFVIQGWMVNRLRLSGTELQTFAIIYGFCQDQVSDFHGSVSYIADFTCTTRQSVTKALNKLCEKDLLIKKVCKGDPNYYTVNFSRVKNLDTPCKETLHPPVKNLDTPCKETLHNNIEIRNKDNIEKKEGGPFEKFSDGKAELLEALKAFEEMRKAIKKPLTEKAKIMVCNKLEKMAEGYEDKQRYMIESLEQSTVNCYQGVFPVKDFQDELPKESYTVVPWPEFDPDFTTLEELIP